MPTKGGSLFGEVSNYVLTETVERDTVIKYEASFRLYVIELYQEKFDKEMEEFNKIVPLASMKRMHDVIRECFLNIIKYSEKGYKKASDYMWSPFNGSFRKYCDLD